jgi:siroheme decarboxylase
MKKLTEVEQKVAGLLQLDIPLVYRPFQETGKACGLNGKEVLDITRHLLNKGYIRRIAAILRHQKAGYTRNALVVWSVPSEQIEKAGKILSTFDAVSHCYERRPAFQGKFNLFTMLHTRNEDVLSIIEKMATAAGIKDYLILESIQEYKKKSPEYF